MFEQMKFGVAFASGAASASVQRGLRKMSKNPREPRVFSQAKLLIPTSLVCMAMCSLVALVNFQLYFNGKKSPDEGIIALLVVGVFLVFLLHGLWRRFGVDEDRVWTRFGKVFYREVRFSEITKLRLGVQRYKLYTSETMVNIDYNRFDYALVYYGLLRELQKRRFELPEKVMPGDANWDDEAQIWRNVLAQTIYEEHKEFFANNPEELEYLNSLTEPPAKYEN